MSETPESQFAFGCNEYDRVGCPARQAGFDPQQDRRTAEVAEKYDMKMRNYVGKDEGVVTEDKARRCWLEVLDESSSYSLIKTAKAIAKDHGWK